MNGRAPDPASLTGAAPVARDDLELRATAWIFGDDDEDPGLIAEDALGQPSFLAWLTRLESDYGRLKDTVLPDGARSAQARLAALRDDIRRRRDRAAAAATEQDNVRSLADLRAQKASRRARVVIIGGLVLAAAAAILLFTRGAPPPDVDATVAGALIAELGDDGYGFAGQNAPSARNRGFILGAVIDLSRPRRDRSPPALPDLELARELSTRALIGLDAPDGPERRRQRVLGGCAAILTAPADRAACERGLADYLARRDAFFSR